MSISRQSQNTNLFFNHLKKNYDAELKVFHDSKLERINLSKDPETAKKALCLGGVYVFTLLANNELVMIKRNQDSKKISHAVVAENQDVICAGEVKIINITVNGRTKLALDISNDSGHYRPTAEFLPKIMTEFEKLGLCLYRVTAVHPKIQSTFTVIDEDLGSVNINRTKFC